MRVALVTYAEGTKETGESFLLIDHHEGAILVAAMEEFVQNHPRAQKAKKLLEQMDSVPVLLT